MNLQSIAPLIDSQSLLKDDSFRSKLVVDCWRSDSYERAHIPGAVHITYDYWLKQAAADGGKRGTLLLDNDSLASLFGSLGIDTDRHVVLYDDNGGRAATRVWW